MINTSMLSFKKHLLKEGSNLAPSELYKYTWRVDLFLKKFKNGEPLTLTTKSDIVLSYDPAIEDAIRNKQDPTKIRLLGIDGKQYKLGDFAKTTEFGGGGGSGAGAEMTKLAESAQAVYATARWMGKTDYDNDALTTAYHASRTDELLNNILNELPKEWRDSSILGAEKLYAEFGSKSYMFHRGSGWVSRLEKHFKKLNAKEKVFANLNKWSPADIYMVSSVGQNIKFENTTNVQELNNLLKEALRTRDIIGVSLKLMKKTAKLTFENFGADKPVVKFDKYTTGNKGFFGAKDVYIYFTVNGKIQFRTFSATTFQGEIKGKQANQGKLSYGPIQSILKSIGLPPLIDTNKLKKAIANRNSEILNQFYEYYTRLATDSPKLSYAAFIDECYAKGEDWMYSKYIGCELIAIIKKNNSEDHFVTGCIQYASSTSELSAPFVKLQ